MIGNIWFALLAFVLGAGLTYLRMAGSATRRIAKPVPHRLVMGGIIPGVVDAPDNPAPIDPGPEWKIRQGSVTPSEPASPVSAEPSGQVEPPVEQAEVVLAPQPLEPPEPIEPLQPPEPMEPVEQLQPPAPVEPSEPVEAEPQALAVPVAEVPAAPESSVGDGPAAGDRQVAAGATDEPSTSSWWAAAFDRGDPGPYPGPLRYTSAWPPAGGRVLDVDDEFAAALGAGAAASAASAALFGTTYRRSAEPEPASPAEEARTQEAETASSPAEPSSSSDDPQDEAGEPQIKGNRGSMLYHTPDSPWYGRTKAEEWFHTEQEAMAAGYARWNSRMNN